VGGFGSRAFGGLERPLGEVTQMSKGKTAKVEGDGASLQREGTRAATWE